MKKIFTLCVVLCLSYLSMGATNPKHEFRATWLTTAWGNDWPKTKVTNATTRKQQQDSLIAIFDRLQAGNMNAVCFQVRGRSDAFYQSSYEPWAAELAGARGTDPGYDPLAFAIEEAHKRGLELHAWVNPFRVTSAGTLASTDLVKKNAGQWIIQYNNGSFTGEIIDPGYPEAREYVLNVLMEIISNYDIDGIVMDDYFYPYGGTTTEDAASKALHKPANVVDVNQDGDTDDDWRRSNVDVFLKELYDRIQAKKPWVRFGMGTFGIWTTQTKVAQAYGISLPSGISGLDDYDEQACNPVEWVQNGYVDYINPQLYWPTTSTGQNYNKLCQWWAKDVCEHFSNQLTNGKKVHFFSSQSISSNRSLTEIQAQVDANRSNLSSGYTGSVFFDTDAYLTMDKDLMTSRFATNALTPAMDWKSNTALAAPTNLTVSGSTLTWQHATAERFTVYVYPKGTAWSTAKNDPSYLQGVIYGNSMDISGIDTNMNDIAVCAYDRFGVEHTAAVYSNDSGAGTTPNPETIIWELNGGEVNTVTVEVPSLTTLEAQFKNDYNSYFGAAVATTREITNFLYYGSKEEGGSNLVYNMMNDPASDWKWLRDYIISKSASNTTIQTALLAGTDAHWRYSIVAFLTASAGTNSTYTVDFSIAGQPSKWGTAYQIAHGAVLLPTYVTSAYTLPTPVHPSGYEFLGWYDNAEFAGSPLTTIPANWTGTLYAQWQENAPTIDPTWQILYTSTNGNVVEPYKTNVFGANIVSNIYENGVGTITFDGPVTSIGYQAFFSCNSLTSITIPNSVTSIGNEVFSCCSSLTSITIPNSVTSIGDGAFSICFDIVSATIGNGVTSIGDGAFTLCASLTTVTIGNSVTSIGDNAFDFCAALSSITIPNSVTSIGDEAFAGCSSLTSITIPSSVTHIGVRAFSSHSIESIVVDSENATYDSRNNCNAIIEKATNSLIAGCQNTIIPNSVTSIGKMAFYNCSSLASITIPNSIKSISSSAFYGCSSLSSLTIPNSVTSIEKEAFHACSSLTSITIPNSVTSIGEWVFYDCSSLTSITIPESVTNIGNSAFYGCSSIASITIPESVTSIGKKAFDKCSSLDTIYVEATTPPALGENVFASSPVCHIPCGTLATYESSAWARQVGGFVGDCVEGQQIYYTSTDGNIVTPNDVNVFGANIVSNTYENGVGTITFDGPVTSIGDMAFYGCSGLTSITIPNSVTSIGYRAFNGCSGLTSITIGNSVTSIGDYAFSKCTSLTSITIPNSVTSIGNYVFEYCRSLTSIIIPNSVTTIGRNAFAYCSGLTSIVVDVENTTYDSRENCNAIIETATNTLIAGCQNTIIPDNVTSIGVVAFEGCEELQAITIPNNILKVETYAFFGCSKLTSITIPNSVTFIGQNAFGNCDALVSITVDSTNLVYDSRDNCNAIIYTAANHLSAGCQNTIIPNSVTEIGSYAFGDCNSLTSIVIPNSVRLIGGCAFYSCKNLTSITIPNSVTAIAYGAFMDCSELNTIHIESTTPPTLVTGAFTSSPTCYIPCGTLAAYQASDWAGQVSEFVEDGCIDPTWQILYTSTDGNIVTPYKTNVFGANIVSNTYKNGVGTITFDGPVTTIGNRAFQSCSSITSITIPNSVTSIGDNVFYGCENLTSITIPNSVISIGNCAFQSCSSITSITIPNSVTSIGSYAFHSCCSLSSIVVESGNTIYDSRDNCNAIIKTATNSLIAGCPNTIIPNSVTRIGDDAFAGRSSLVSITIPNSVTSIGSYAFYACTSLTSISIPNSVTSIGGYAFTECSSLTYISIPNSVTSIGVYAFSECSSLTSITVPNSVTSIGKYVFRSCSSLDKIYVKATTPPILEEGVFEETPASICYIPCGTFAAYEATNWANQVGKFIEEGCAPPIDGIVIFDADVDQGNAATDFNNAAAYQITKDGVTVDVSTGCLGGTVNSMHYRIYMGQTLTITSTVGNIAKVEFTCTSRDDAKYGPGCFTWSAGDYTYSGAVGTWTGDTCEVVFKASTNQVRATQIEVTLVDKLLQEKGITYELNGGVTNYHGWMSKDDMYHDLLVDINAIIPTTRVDVDTVTLAYDKTKNIQKGIPTYWDDLSSLLIHSDFLSKWGWLINYMDSACASESKYLPSTLSVYLRYNLSAFFFEKEYTSWPQTPDYSKYSLYPYYQPAWQHAYDNPTNPTEEFILNAPYREGYTFAGWYTTPDFSGEKITIVEAETNDTLYAKWIENSLVESTWKVLYTSTNGGIVAPNAIDVFGANIVSNTYENGVGTITFDGPVTSIGTEAFHDCLTLKSITIPNSVNSIGVQAFRDCSAIDSLTIPENVNSISGWAFMDCSSLLSIVVAQENMTYDSRENCNAIIETATNTLIVGCKKTIIPNGVATIGEHAFRISSLAFITIPNSVTNIERLAFCGSSIDTIYVEATTPPALEDSTVFMNTPAPVCVIPCGTLAAYEASDWASQVGSFMEDCVEGQQIYYTSTDGNIVTPYATDVFGANIVSNTYENGQGVITFDGPVTSIGRYAFYGCSGLTSITIGNSVTSIGDYAFSKCTSLTSITIPNSVTSIGDYAFSKCTSLTSIIIPNSVTTIGRNAFAYYSGLTSIVVDVENTTYDSRENCNAIIETATNTLITGCQNTIIPNSVTSIGRYAFYGCDGLTSITIPNSVTSIGNDAFNGCTFLSSITIPNGVTTIGANAFLDCSSLTSITVPNSVTSIGVVVLGGCASLTSIVVEDDNATYDSRNNCNAIIETSTNTLIAGCQNTIIPNNVTSIGTAAFRGCSAMVDITIPNSITTIGWGAFQGCSSLTSITIPNSVTSILTFAFHDCSSLDRIRVEATNPPILKARAFEDTPSPTCYIPCGTLDAYQASDWASQVSEFVEEGCVPIQMCGDDLYWEYADGVLTITGTGDMYDYAADTDVPWYDVRGNIKTVSLPDAMTKIGQNAFYKCTAMTSINMPTSLTAIGEKAFAQDTKLACEIILPASMTNIASRAFFNCQAVPAFHVEATTPPTVQADAFDYTTAPIHIPCGYGHIYGKHAQWGVLNLEMCELLQDNVYYYPIDGHTARAVTYHSNPTDTIVIPSAVVIDGMPRTVTEVADFAFTDCANLPAIYFNEGLEYIGERAFVRCYGLHGTIVLPATLETIGERAFSYCDNVEKYLIQAMTPPALGNDVFTCANHDALFYVSCEAMDDYKVAARWSSLKSRLRDACLNIYHYNTALGANGVHTTEDTLVASIYYRRKFTTSRWETLYLPFEVDRVTVLEDGVEYDLKAWSIFSGGHYYLAKPYGIENKEVVFGFTQVVDAHTPYIIQFKEPYYHDKMITFHGKESWNKLSTSFEALPISFEMQMAGNTTLQDQILEEPVYMLRATSNFILQNTTTTLHPFECYVMPYATPSGTPARMNVRFRGNVPTAVESVKGNESHLTYTVDGYTLTVYPQGQAFSIYSLNGALIYSCEAGKEAVDCELNSGCYLLHAGTEAHKIML